MIVQTFGNMACTVLPWLAIEPTNLKRFLPSGADSQPEAVGGEQMAPARMPRVAVPQSPSTGSLRSSELPWCVSPAGHTALIQLQGRAGKWLCPSSVTCKWSGKFRQGEGTSCWGVC